MISAYTYSLLNNFPLQKVCESLLEEEIRASSMIVNALYVNVNVTGFGNVDISFDEDISSADKIILDYIISIHTGEQYVVEGFVKDIEVGGDGYFFGDISVVGTVNGVDISDHHSHHEIGGDDVIIAQNLSSGSAQAGKILETNSSGGYSLIPTPIGGGGSSDTISAYDDKGDIKFTKHPVQIKFNKISLNTNTDTYSMDNKGTINISPSGSYIITFDVSIYLKSSHSNSISWLEIDSGSGFESVDGTDGFISHGKQKHVASTSVSIGMTLSSGDKLRVMSKLYYGKKELKTHEHGSRITIIKVS